MKKTRQFWGFGTAFIATADVRTANQPTIAAAALFIKTKRWIPLLFIPGALCVPFLNSTRSTHRTTTASGLRSSVLLTD
jgi:hypothetical protein